LRDGKILFLVRQGVAASWLVQRLLLRITTPSKALDCTTQVYEKVFMHMMRKCSIALRFTFHQEIPVTLPLTTGVREGKTGQQGEVVELLYM